MENRLKITLICSLIGIFILIFLASTLQPPIKEISQISYKDINQRIKIKGQISEIKEFSETSFKILTIKQNNYSITGILYSSNSIKPLINKSKDYFITGTIEKYNQTLQINIQEIKW